MSGDILQDYFTSERAFMNNISKKSETHSLISAAKSRDRVTGKVK